MPPARRGAAVVSGGQAKEPAGSAGAYTPLVWALGMREGLTSTTKAVLVALASYANSKGSCFPSIQRIADDTRLSERSCQKAIPELEAGGFLTVNRNTGRGHASVYQLNLRRPIDAVKGALRSPINVGERAQPVHPLPVERVNDVHPLERQRVQDVHPLPTERVHHVRSKGEPRAPQLPIEVSKQAAREKAGASTRVLPTRNPRRSDPRDAWRHLADRWPDGRPKLEAGPNAGDDLGRPLVAGTYLDVAVDLVCESAQIGDADWRGDWQPVVGWLRDGLDLHQHILPAIRRVASRSGYQPPRSLRYFDSAVRERRAA